MALTKIGTDGVKDDAVNQQKIADECILNSNINTSAAIQGSKLADNSISLAKLEHGDSNNNGKFLRANNGADPTFEAINNDSLVYPNGNTGVLTSTNDVVEINGKVNWDNDPNNTYGISFDAPTTLTKDSNFTLPEDGSNGQFLKTNGSGVLSFATVSTTPEGTAILSTGESGGTKFLREDGDGSCSWQAVPAGTTINNQGDNRVITSTATTDTLNGEANLTYTGTNFGINDSSPSYELVVKADDANQSEIQILAGGTGKESNILFGDPNDDDVGKISYDHNGDHMKFITGTTERFRVNQHGLCIGGTGSANGLDDYEYGTWTGSINTGTANINDEWYVKVGTLVMGGGGITAISDTSSNSAIKVNGLPFSASDTGYGAVGGSKNTAFSQMCVTQVSGSSVLLMKSSTSTGSWNYILHSDQVQSTGGIVFSFQYFVN